MNEWMRLPIQTKVTYDHRGPPKNIPEDKSKEQIEATIIFFLNSTIYL